MGRDESSSAFPPAGGAGLAPSSGVRRKPLGVVEPIAVVVEKRTTSRAKRRALILAAALVTLAAIAAFYLWLR